MAAVQYYPQPTYYKKIMAQATAVMNWCFTSNNPESEPRFQKSIMKYLVFGREVGESGTPHLQGYVQLLQRKRLSFLRNNMGGSFHWESAKGNCSQNQEYCKKDGNFQEFGEARLSANEKRKRNRAEKCEEIKEMTKGKRRRLSMAERFPNMVKDIDALQMFVPKRTDAPKVLYLYGDTGSTITAIQNAIMDEIS